MTVNLFLVNKILVQMHYDNVFPLGENVIHREPHFS